MTEREVANAYSPQHEYRVHASTLIDGVKYHEGDREKQRLMIDEAAVAIAIADHYQRDAENGRREAAGR